MMYSKPPGWKRSKNEIVVAVLHFIPVSSGDLKARGKNGVNHLPAALRGGQGLGGSRSQSPSLLLGTRGALGGSTAVWIPALLAPAGAVPAPGQEKGRRVLKAAPCQVGSGERRRRKPSHGAPRWSLLSGDKFPEWAHLQALPAQLKAAYAHFAAEKAQVHVEGTVVAGEGALAWAEGQLALPWLPWR